MICKTCDANDWCVQTNQGFTTSPPKFKCTCRVCGNWVYATSKEIYGEIDAQDILAGALTAGMLRELVPDPNPEPARDPVRVVLDLVHDIPGAEIVLERERYVIRLPR